MFWERFYNLCVERGVKPNTVTKELGFSSSVCTHWKQGKQSPSLDKLTKLADYFGVSVDYLSGKETTSENDLSLPAVFETRGDVRERLRKLSPKDVDDLIPFLDYLIGRHGPDGD